MFSYLQQLDRMRRLRTHGHMNLSSTLLEYQHGGYATTYAITVIAAV